MTEYTPSTARIRESATQPWHEPVDYNQHAEELAFDSWLAAHDREVAAKALREAAAETPMNCYDPRHQADWLRARADEILGGRE